MAGWSPLAGIVLGGSTIAPPPTEAQRTPEDRSEYIGGLVSRAAQQSPFLLLILSKLTVYTIWAEVAMLLLKLGLAAAVDADVLDKESMMGLVALRLLKDERATLEEEKRERGIPEHRSAANGASAWRSPVASGT